MSKKPLNEIHVSVHEAGHCLVSLMLNIDFERVTIQAEPGEALGKIVFRSGPDNEAEREAASLRGYGHLSLFNLLALLGGRAAERVAFGQVVSSAYNGDENQFFEYFTKRWYLPGVSNAAVKRLAESTFEALEDYCLEFVKDRRETLFDLAMALLNKKTLSAAEAREIFQNSTRKGK